MDTNLHKIFTITTRDINQASIAKAAGYDIETYKEPCGRRALFTFSDNPEVRDLLDRYERREALPLSAKSILNARTELYHAASRSVRGGL